ncbi:MULTISPECIES: hypothetical protein [Enterococcus]|uniref:hypothetical protein n=1 Tax=Enterococcus TaxID=1350 RepID=UPI0001F0D19D|nr:hypothetical protein [Enterococcus faecalis]EFT94318.1 hypothetical protein HMPREF9499_01523 [Enterococcus faecalis TX0012]
MKYLKIENNQGYFLTRSHEWNEIDKISKEDIYELIKILIAIENSESFEMDEFNEEILQHGVHKIIYRNLYTKFTELKQEKDSIIDRVNQQFSTAFQKYSNE